MSSRGGKRAGAGRPPGSINRATRAQKKRLSEFAREHSDLAIDVLCDVAKNGNSESARVAAANALLDRAYGKPRLADQREYSDEHLSGSVMSAEEAQYHWENMLARYGLPTDMMPLEE